MNKNIYKLIIWDFDGVIADSEKIWLENRKNFFNERLGINLNFDEVNQLFGGQADKTKRETLLKMGYPTDNEFWRDVLKIDEKYMEEHGLEVMPGVMDILKNNHIKQCIATGGILSKTLLKLDAIKFGNIIPKENIFTVDLVEKGKPEPDLFLYAAKVMGEKPENSIVIEDSIAGMTAGIKAKMTVIAFLGAKMYQNQDYIDKVKKLRVAKICFDMQDVKKFLQI